MKNISLILLLWVFDANCQLWKEPFDTLSYIDNLERLKGNQIGIKSISVTRYNDRDSILQFDYFEYDNEGYLTEITYAPSPSQEGKTTKYHYLNGVIQEPKCKREFIYNADNRLLEIRQTNGDSTWSINYQYQENKLSEIRYSNSSWKTFKYDTNGNLNRKEIYQQGKLVETFDFYFPEKNVTIYSDCHRNMAWNDSLIACDSTIGIFSEHGNLLMLKKYNYMDSVERKITFEYTAQGDLTMITYHQPTANATELYIRNKLGMITRKEYYYDDKCYMYSIYDYTFY